MLVRRDLFKNVVKGSLGLLAGRLSAGEVEQALDLHDVGVASGEPTASSIVLWTRVGGLNEESARPDSLLLSYVIAEDPALQNIVGQGTLQAKASDHYTVRALVGELRPATTYFYQFRAENGYVSVLGRTRTAPADNDMRPVRFATTSCQDFRTGYFNVLEQMCHESIDFVVQLGDNIYERGSQQTPLGVRHDGINGGGETLTLADYRAKYQLYLTDPWLRELRRMFPIIYMADDHEVFDNYAGAALSAAEKERQCNGMQAFFEYMPLTTVEQQRSLRYGGLLDIIVTDQRQYRDARACGGDLIYPGCAALEREGRTMLGDSQRDWLLDRLSSSGARWKFLMSELMMTPLKIMNLPEVGSPQMMGQPSREYRGGLWVNLDAWDGYPRERSIILSEVLARQVQNLVVFSGDIHNFFAGYLSPDRDSRVAGVELTTASVSSRNFADLAGRGMNWAVPGMRRANPNLAFADFNSHGYVVVQALPEGLEAQFKAVSTVLSPVASCTVLQRFLIPDGRPELRLV